MAQPSRLWAIALIVLGVGLGLQAFRPVPSTAQPAGVPGGVPRYSVVETEGTNLLVTDNASDTLYFYTVDPEKNAGDELKLRGELSLREVGKPVIKPRTHKHEK
jgi:hypothetical protein